jgi:hypothetical protein
MSLAGPSIRASYPWKNNRDVLRTCLKQENKPQRNGWSIERSEPKEDPPYERSELLNTGIS